jgi:hypothetical protein
LALVDGWWMPPKGRSHKRVTCSPKP